MVFKNLLRHKGRTLLTFFGIVIGVMAIVALGATASGLQDGFLDAFSGSGADLILTQKDAWTITNSAVPDSLGSQLARVKGIQAVAGMSMAIAKTEASPYFFVFAHDPQGFAVARYKIVEGQSLGEAAGSSRPLILGKLAAESQGLRTGDALSLNGVQFQVVGIYETGAGLEDGGAVISLADAQALFGKVGQVGSYLIKLQSPAEADQVQQEVERQFPEVQMFVPAALAAKQQTIQIVQGMSWALAFLAIVIGSVTMVNTMVMNVFERTREIGTLRAVGWSSGRALRLVLAESVLLAFVGGVVGSLVGVVIALAMSRVPLLSFVGKGVSLGLFVQGIGTAVVLGSLGGLYPAWRASRLMPVEALRYEAGAEVRGGRWLPPVMRSLWRRRTRSLLTIVGLTIAITAIITLGGVADGYIGTFTTMMTSTQADLIVRQANATSLSTSRLDESVAAKIRSVPGVQAVMGSLHYTAQTEKIPTLLVQGYNLNEFGIQHFRAIEGQGLSGDGQILLGRKGAAVLGLAVGDSLQLGGMSFQVQGLYETGVVLEDMNGAVVTLQDAQALADAPGKVTVFGVKLSNPADANLVRSDVAAAAPDLNVVKSSEFGESLTELQGISMLASAVWVLAVIVGGLGMMNTMLMSMLERTREVGTLRALGWPRGKVLWMLLKESLVLSLIGLVIGAGLAALIGWGFGRMPAVSAYLSFSLNVPLVVRALIFAAGLSLVGGLYPAWRAAKLQPAEALQYE